MLRVMIGDPDGGYRVLHPLFVGRDAAVYDSFSFILGDIWALMREARGDVQSLEQGRDIRILNPFGLIG